MALATLNETEAREQLSEWLKANRKVAVGQSYSIEGRSLSRTDSAEIRRQINYWSRIVAAYDRRNAGLTTTVRAKSGIFC